MSIWIEVIGYIAGVCTAICFLPQTIRTLKHKKVRDLSKISYVIYCVGIACWVVYGFYIGSIQMVVFNLISLVFAGAILFMIIKYKSGKSQSMTFFEKLAKKYLK